jgi:hypothetical protein
VGFGDLTSSVGLPQHADEHRPQRPVLLAVDQQLGECTALWVAPELTYPVGSVEVGKHQDVEEFGTGSGTERVQAFAAPSLDLLYVQEVGR